MADANSRWPMGEMMYAEHFGLRQRPFASTPDSECYYPATSHEQALGRLLQGIALDEGLLLLTAEPGMGKTLLCHRLVERLGESTVSAFLTNSHFASRTGLLQAILFELGLPHEGKTEQELRLALTAFALENFAAGQRLVIVVDEAQHLSADLLEELRLLGNLEGKQGKAVQVVLVAQPAILDTLAARELATCRQRLVVRACIAPMEVHEAVDYIFHHLRLAGGRPEAIITDEALEILARGTQGVPRLINQLCQQAMLLVAEAEATQVDAEVAIEVLTQRGLACETDEEPADGLERFPSLTKSEMGGEGEVLRPAG